MLARQSALVLKVGVSYGMKMAKCVASYSQDKAVLAVYIALSKRRFSRPSLVTRQRALVFKVGALYRWRNI